VEASKESATSGGGRGGSWIDSSGVADGEDEDDDEDDDDEVLGGVEETVPEGGKSGKSATGAFALSAISSAGIKRFPSSSALEELTRLREISEAKREGIWKGQGGIIFSSEAFVEDSSLAAAAGAVEEDFSFCFFVGDAAAVTATAEEEELLCSAIQAIDGGNGYASFKSPTFRGRTVVATNRCPADKERS